MNTNTHRENDDRMERAIVALFSLFDTAAAAAHLCFVYASGMCGCERLTFRHSTYTNTCAHKYIYTHTRRDREIYAATSRSRDAITAANGLRLPVIRGVRLCGTDASESRCSLVYTWCMVVDCFSALHRVCSPRQTGVLWRI